MAAWGLLSGCSVWAQQLYCQLPLIMWDLTSPTRDQTQVPCTGRRILNPWTTKEAPHSAF